MKPRKNRLSLRGLRTFCIAAQRGSFRLAAEDLFVTPSAVSHQIKTLEDELDLRLFDRSVREVSLTDAGETLLSSCGPLISQLDDVVANFFERHGQGHLRVSVQPFFATELLVPRLSGFIGKHPGISIDLDTEDQAAAKHPEQADVSIRLFRSAPENLAVRELFRLRLVPACSREFLAKRPEIDAGQLTDLPMIIHSKRRHAWRDWAKMAGAEIGDQAGAIYLETMISVARAAEEGLGIALVPLPLSESWFRENKLVRLSEYELETPDRYFVVARKEDAQRSEVRAFRRWAQREFAQKE